MLDSSTISATTRSVVQQAYACAARADFAAFGDLLSDDVTVTETAHHPCPGSWHSKAEVLEGDRACVPLVMQERIDYVHAADGTMLAAMPMVGIHKVRDGKIYYGRDFIEDTSQFPSIFTS